MTESAPPVGSRIERLADAAVGLISPYRAHLRRHFRRMDQDEVYRNTVFAMLDARGYRNAKSSGSTTPWFGGDTSADANLATDLPNLRARSQETNRDDPIGSGLTKTFVNNVVGRGIMPQSRTRQGPRNKAIEAVFADCAPHLDRANDCSFAEHQRLVFRKVLEDGEVLVHEVKREAAEAVWFEVIEAARLNTPMAGKPAGAVGTIRHGVERDAAGVPIAYWVNKRHPGDVTEPGSVSQWNQFTRIPAETAVHLKFTERPGQTRGVPMFHAVLQDLRDLDLLILAALKRTQVAACLSVFIKSPRSTTNILSATAAKYGYKLDQTLEPGMIFKLFPEEEINTVSPNFPTPELAPFIIMLARRVGAALGVSWQIVLKDFSDSTYSSARTDLLEARVVYGVMQSWLIEKLLTWEWQRVLLDAQLRGDRRLAGVKPEELRSVQWISPGWDWVDPAKKAIGIRIMMALGLTCRSIEAAALGRDWEEVQDMLLLEELRERTRREELGLPPPEQVAEMRAALLGSLTERDDEERRPPRRINTKDQRLLAIQLSEHVAA